MLELAEIFYLQQNNRDASQLYEQYVRNVGQKNQGARALLDWYTHCSSQCGSVGNAGAGQPDARLVS